MARRKKTSPLEDVLDLLAMLPWWACVVLAAVSYLSLHPLAAPIQASDIQGQGGAMVGAMMQKAVIHGLATAGQYIVPILCLAAAALSAWRRKQRHTLVSDVAQARNADESSLIRALAERLAAATSEAKNVWCVFDNTASGAATDNALDLQQLLNAPQ